MADAMVTARMSQEKKDAGNRVLEKLGTNASQTINQLYDYLIQNGELPFPAQEESHEHTPEEIAEAVAWADDLVSRIAVPSRFATMSDDEIRQERLIARGLATKEDFE